MKSGFDSAQPDENEFILAKHDDAIDCLRSNLICSDTGIVSLSVVEDCPRTALITVCIQ